MDKLSQITIWLIQRFPTKRHLLIPSLLANSHLSFRYFENRFILRILNLYKYIQLNTHIYTYIYWFLRPTLQFVLQTQFIKSTWNIKWAFIPSVAFKGIVRTPGCVYRGASKSTYVYSISIYMCMSIFYWGHKARHCWHCNYCWGLIYIYLQ